MVFLRGIRETSIGVNASSRYVRGAFSLVGLNYCDCFSFSGYVFGKVQQPLIRSGGGRCNRECRVPPLPDSRNRSAGAERFPEEKRAGARGLRRRTGVTCESCSRASLWLRSTLRAFAARISRSRVSVSLSSPCRRCRFCRAGWLRPIRG